jgi:hypothetical protein
LSKVSVQVNGGLFGTLVGLRYAKKETEEVLTNFYSASGMNLVYIGMFIALLFLTSRTIEEATFYRDLLRDYRWTIRVTSRVARCIDFAVQQLDTSLQHIDQLSPNDVMFKTFELSKYWKQHGRHTENEGSVIGSSSSPSVQLSVRSVEQAESRARTQHSYSTLEIIHVEDHLSRILGEATDTAEAFEEDWSPFAGSKGFSPFM